MKTLILHSGKGLLLFVLFLFIQTAAFSQNRLAAVISSINYEYALPIAVVAVLAVFMFKAFIRQKHH